MSYQIRYTNKWTGQTSVHTYQGNQAGAEGWARTLSQENSGCRSECVHIADGPYDHSGTVEHVITVGNDRK